MMNAIKDLKRFVRTAQGLEPAELVLKNAEVFHAFTGEFIKCDVAITDGHVAGLGEYSGQQEMDLTGHYITPGFIDGHVHIESSMMSPREFARAVIPTGTTTVVADPHEIANVAGAEGIQYMLDATENLPLNVYIMLPSCVPATPLEDSGASLAAADLAPFLNNPRVLGLAEMMNAPGVLMGDDGVYDKLLLAADSCVDGHAPGLTGKPLMGYAAAGIRTDHECATQEQAMERLRAGMYVLIREGTAVKNLKALLPIVNADTSAFCCFAADDKIPAELLGDGYINEMVRIAIKEGIPVATALQMATINTARCYGLRDLGAIAPHYRADILVFDDLDTWKPSMVFKDGQLASERSVMLLDPPELRSDRMEHTMHLADLRPEQLCMPLAGDEAQVIGLIPYQILTKNFRLKVKKVAGNVVSDPENQLLKLAVFERHHATGRVGLGLVKGFGLQHGALASTVAHDSHNLITIGAPDEDMLVAARELERIGGGIAIALDGKIVGSLALPIAGLMSKECAEVVAQEVGTLIAKAHELGVYEYYAPFLTLAFLSLPVIPELKLTDRGLVDVNAFRIVPLAAQ